MRGKRKKRKERALTLAQDAVERLGGFYSQTFVCKLNGIEMGTLKLDSATAAKLPPAPGFPVITIQTVFAPKQNTDLFEWFKKIHKEAQERQGAEDLGAESDGQEEYTKKTRT